MNRKESREMVMKYIYQMTIKEEYTISDIPQFCESFNDSNKVDKFFEESICNTINNIERIDEIIAKYLKGWESKRIPKIDLAILRLAISEMMADNEIPYGVTINEAVEISKKYSKLESYKYINGVLASYYAELTNKDE